MSRNPLQPWSAKRLHAAAGALGVAIGGVVLTSWALGWDATKSMLPGSVSMKANAALAFVLVGAGMLLGTRSGSWPRVGRLCALLAGAIGLLTLGEYAFGRDLGIDQALFREPRGTAATSHPGRMAPDTAFSFVLLSAGTWHVAGRAQSRLSWGAAALSGAVVTSVALAALVSFLAPTFSGRGWWGLTHMAVATAALFAFQGMATVLVSWQKALGAALTPFSTHLWRMAACVAALAIAFALYARSETNIDSAHELRHRSFLLADELRQSGDDLTRMVRTYVVTGDPVYKQRFHDILDIRDGKKPRPRDYWKPYWDLVSSDASAPSESDEPVPLLDLMRQAGFTHHEFEILAEAKRSSDGLTIPEIEAMRLVESTGPEAEADRARARAMLYDARYHQAKVAVMRPIRDFLGLVDLRTRTAVESAEKSSRVFRDLFAACILALMIVLWRGYAALHGTLGANVDEVHAQIATLGGGDFSAPIQVKAGLEDSVLGWLAVTQAKLDQSTREQKRVETEIRTLASTLEERVAERTDQLEAANQELESFSYSVSHDLRAPIRAIDGYGRILREDHADALDAEARRVLGVISDETRRMGQLIDDLLAFSRLGRQKLASAPVDMTALAQEVFEQERARVTERAVELELEPLLPGHGDRNVLRIVLDNLLSNAIKFSARREPAVIELGSRREAGQIIYWVRDNGVGFDMKYAHKLFGVFQRLHSASEFEGTGVGLALVQRIVHRHGGRVWAEAKVGEGATFWFSLPAVEGSP